MNENMENRNIINEKFKDLSYDKAIEKLNSLISQLERGDGTFDELMAVYKEAFEYYTFCSDYLSVAGEKIKNLNSQITAISNPLEDIV